MALLCTDSMFDGPSLGPEQVGIDDGESDGARLGIGVGEDEAGINRSNDCG